MPEKSARELRTLRKHKLRQRQGHSGGFAAYAAAGVRELARERSSMTHPGKPVEQDLGNDRNAEHEQGQVPGSYPASAQIEVTASGIAAGGLNPDADRHDPAHGQQYGPNRYHQRRKPGAL